MNSYNIFPAKLMRRLTPFQKYTNRRLGYFIQIVHCLLTEVYVENQEFFDIKLS